MHEGLRQALFAAGFEQDEVSGDPRFKKLLEQFRDSQSLNSQSLGDFSEGIINSISGPVIVFDHKFQYLAANRYFLDILNIQRFEDIIGKRAGSFEVDSFLLPVFKGLISTQQSNFKWEANISNELRSSWYMFSALKVGNTNPKFVVTGFEVSSMKMQQALLMDSEDRYRASFQNVSVGICQLDHAFNVENFNKTFANLLGLKKTPIVGRKISSLLTGDPGKRLAAQLEALRSLEEPTNFNQIDLELDYTITSEQIKKTLWFEISLKKLMGRTGDIFFVVTLKDVSEQKRAFHKLEQSQSALMYNEKMAALGEMAGGLAHEINNPLAIITGRTQLMRDRLENHKKWIQKDVDQMLRFAASIQKTCGRISKIVSGLKIFSSSEHALHLEPHEICLNDLVENAFTVCVERFKNSNIELRLEIDSEEQLQVMGLRDQLTQVLFNLLNNAFDYVKELENPWVLIRLAGAEGKTARIQIQDSGKGIPKENINKIFQPLFTTKKVGQGTGLGLSISKGIIESHGGRLLLDAGASNTCFTVEIPRIVHRRDLVDIQNKSA